MPPPRAFPVFIAFLALLGTAFLIRVAHAENMTPSPPAPVSQSQPEDVSSNPAYTPPSLDFITRPDEDLLICSLKLGQIALQDVILVYDDQEKNDYFIPFEDFLISLEIPIEIDARRGLAKGWFISEKKTFFLDMSSGKVVVGDQTLDLSASDIERHDDGQIYVAIKALEKWFPLTLDVNFSQLSVIIKTLEPFPVELRFARDKDRQKLYDPDTKGKKEYPLDNTDVPGYSIPIIQTNSQIAYDHAEYANEPLSTSATALGSGLFANQDLSFSVNKTTAGRDQTDIRASLGRKDLDGNLMGMGISEYEAGDVSTGLIPMLTRGAAGRGLSVSTMPINSAYSAQSGTVQLRGDLPVGYQIDIKRNGQLLGFLENPDENGEYIFDVDVFPGLNVFELVFYGPQGQKEIREERIYVPSTPVKQGSLGLRANVMQDNTNLLTDRAINNDEDQGKTRAIAEAEYGLTDTSSLYGALADLSVEGTRHQYGLARYSRTLKGIRTDLSHAVSEKGAHAEGIRFQSIFRGISWQLQHEYYKDFISEETLRPGLSGGVEHGSTMRLSGAMPYFNNIPFSFKLEHFLNPEGLRRIEWDGRVTKNISKVRVTSGFSQRTEDHQNTQTDYNLQLSSRYEKISLRGGLIYNIAPDPALSSSSLVADWNINNRNVLSLGWRRSDAEDPVNSILIGGSRKFNAIELGLNFRYDDNGDYQALLGSSFSLGYDPYDKSIMATEKNLSQTAMYASRVFYDKNNNHLYDGDDELMQDTAFSGPGVDREQVTNEDGYSLLTGIQPYTRNTLQINESTLPDPFMRPGEEPRDYILRPGQTIKKDFPIIFVGEIDGDVYIAKYGALRTAPSVPLQIISKESGDVIREAKSEYDGFIWLRDIPMGQYIARADSKVLQSRGYCVPYAQNITLTTDEPVASISKVFLWPIEKEDTIGISLVQKVTIDEAVNIWSDIKEKIPEILPETIDPPFGYIVSWLTHDHHEGHDENNAGAIYDLVLKGLSKTDARSLCDTLKNDTRSITCKPIKLDAPCPALIEEIDQIQIDKLDLGNPPLEDRLRKDITQEDLIEIIDN